MTIRTAYLSEVVRQGEKFANAVVVWVANGQPKVRRTTFDRAYHTLGPPWPLVANWKDHWEDKPDSDEKRAAWRKFKKDYIFYLKTNDRPQDELLDLQNLIIRNADKDVVLVCYENDPYYCHRHILAEVIKEL